MPADEIRRADSSAAWEATAGERGYFCVKDAGGRPLVQGEAERDRREIHLKGDEPIVIDKMFGPLVFAPIRVTASIDTCEWIVERLYGENNEWREVMRVPGQIESDFTE